MTIPAFLRKFWKSTQREREVRNLAPSAPVVIFLHGLGGSSHSTWSSMLSLCDADPQLKDIHFDTYEFNTALFRLPFQIRMPKLQQLAAGLASEINIKHSQRKKVFLVGHSLGGLVGRQYILSEIKKSNALRVSGLLLFATPNTGASLASVGASLSWNHQHLKQLTNDADILQILNEDWMHFKVESLVKVKYISGGADAIVEPSSSIPYPGGRNSETLIRYDHRSIITPSDHHDMRYLVLQNFLLDLQISAAPSSGQKPPDPLFDIYHATHEPYYFKRSIDEHILNQLVRRPLWLSGPSGVGKTTILRHLSLTSGWSVGQLMLGGCTADAPDALLRSMCEQLADLQRSTEELPQNADVQTMIAYFRRQLRLAPLNATQCLIIEEIPLHTHGALEIFLGHILHLILSIESDVSISNRLVIAFSSIYDPAEALNGRMIKLREHLQVGYLAQWSQAELEALIETLCAATGIVLSNSESIELARAAHGSPRFVKMALRKIKENVETCLSDAIEAVKVEQL